MYSLNRATIIGNLTQNPELRQIPSGQSVCTFGVATNRSWTGQDGQKQESAEFHNVVAWGKLAEICSQYLQKGRKVYIEGRLQTRDWEGQDGVRKYRTEIVTENMIILDKPSGGSASRPATAGTSHATAGTRPAVAGFTPPEPVYEKYEPSASPDNEIRVEDIPF